MFANPNEDALRALLKGIKTVAVVGLSPKEDRPSYRVAAGLQKLGIRIVPVHPTADVILGEKVYASLREIPFAVDVADIFRDPAHIEPIVDDSIAIRVPCLWLQDGVVNEAQALRAQAAGIQVIMDRCIWRDAVALLV